MSKYRHVAVTLSPAVGQDTRFTMRVESSMYLLTTVLDQIAGWRRRNPGCTVYPDSHAGHGMALHVFGEGSKILFSVYVAEIEPEYLTDELKRLKPTDRWAEWKVVDEAFRSFEADLAATAVPEAA